MGTRAIERGPTAARVAANVRAMREKRGLSLVDLAERLRQVGRPTQSTAINKIEQGERRVDVDDLVALALALDVTPNRLLLPPVADDTRVDVTPNRLLLPPVADDTRVEVTPKASGTAGGVWRWACGDAPFERDLWEKVTRLDLDRLRRFVAENRPHARLEETPLADIAEWLRSGALAGLIDGVRAARKAGVPHTAIRDFVLGFEEFARLLGEAAQALDPADRRRKADDGEHRKET